MINFVDFLDTFFKLSSGIDIYKISLPCRLFVLADKEEGKEKSPGVTAVSQAKSADLQLQNSLPLNLGRIHRTTMSTGLTQVVWSK